VVIDSQARDAHGRGHAAQRAPGAVVAVLLLGLSALAGCGSSPEEPLLQRVAYCQGHSSDRPDSGFLHIEFRQGSAVVGSGSVATGGVVAAEVPVGATQIYVDGVQVGAVDEGVDPDVHSSPAPGDVTYVTSGEGCPDQAALGSAELVQN
jgi:hypothetical protein